MKYVRYVRYVMYARYVDVAKRSTKMVFIVRSQIVSTLSIRMPELSPRPSLRLSQKQKQRRRQKVEARAKIVLV